MEDAKKFVEYARVSTNAQGQTGLGIGSQSVGNLNYISSQNGILLRTFTEVQSGTSRKLKMNIDTPMNIDDIFNRRPQLVEAIRFCQSNDATLVVYDIERLGRSEFLISYLVQCGIKFVCSAYPQDPPMILSIRAAIGSEEARKISENTKKALKELKDKGVKLGNPYTKKDKYFTEVNIDGETVTTNQWAVPYIKKMRDEEKLSFREIARRLNEQGYSTTTGKLFQKSTIEYLLQRS